MGRLASAKVLSNEQVGPGIFRLVMSDAGLAAEAQPGQFLNIKVSGSTAPLLRRPLSIHWAAGEQIEVLFQVVGSGTEMLARVKDGDCLDVQGPLGQGFQVKAEGRAILLGGGMGIAPLALLAKELAGKSVLGILGGRNSEILMAAGGRRLEEIQIPLKFATDDGSLGIKGLVTELLASELQENDYIYACGPKAMLKEAARLAEKAGVDCQVSLEEHMGCGVGACLGCVCKGQGRDGNPVLKRVCTDGPVFSAGEVDWA